MLSRNVVCDKKKNNFLQLNIANTSIQFVQTIQQKISDLFKSKALFFLSKELKYNLDW